VYVLVLGDWDDGLKLVAPFGPMLEPATRGELRTRREELSLAVLCLWNTHTVPVARLQWGWVVDQMHEDEIQEAWSVFKHAATGSPLNFQLEDRVGVPILNADDPRTIYQGAEFHLMSPLSEGILTSAERGRVVHFPSFVGELDRQAHAIAASSESRHHAVERFYCADFDLFIDLFMRSNSRRAILFVRDKKGAPSLGRANAEAVDLTGVPLGKVTGAFASLSILETVPGIALRACSGDVLQLEPADFAKAAPEPDSIAWLLERACDNEALALFSDSQLAQLFSCEHLPIDIQASLSGEILLRQWLYRGEASPFLDENLCKRLSRGLRDVFAERKGSDGLKEIESNTFPEDSPERLAWSVFSRRAIRFLRADGVIPVLVAAGEAVPIPFRFGLGLLPDCKVIDLSGHTVENWVPVVRRLEAGFGESLGIVLDVDLGDDIGRIQGGSLALPVLIAKSRTLGNLPDFQPLRLLASGVEQAGSLYPADGHQAKAALAKRMGAQFITVGSGESEIQSGIATRDIHSAVLARITEEVPRDLTPRQLRDAIRLIGDEIKSGQITLETAERRLIWHQEALEPQSQGGLVSEARLLAITLQGAICNHKGETEKAALLNDSARKEALERKNPSAYVDASAHQVVSLTDLGFIPEAEAMGRSLLSWVRKEMQGSDEDRKRAEMTAAGVLGGQVLLQAALAGKDCGDESRAQLRNALQLAREIENGREICFDAVQLAGWHALLQPARTEEAFHDAFAELAAFPKSVNAVSLAYLLRIRFLGAYRHWLKTGSVPER
ncbi:MAG: hypothetical protein ORN83_15630, partial [Chthoniobacteraceae bacterium]|nr:hypothetical protein [Chthoniobacteraceae bacterium]